jgi:hypothetical protein
VGNCFFNLMIATESTEKPGKNLQPSEMTLCPCVESVAIEGY